MYSIFKNKVGLIKITDYNNFKEKIIIINESKETIKVINSIH